tara:strand:+ start:136 stop:522 length:387 start_codon:yes stop_codon:yes gene_type:complete
MENITIYSNNTCPYCKSIKDHLEKEGIKFENKITAECLDEWKEVINLTNMPNVPTIKYKDEYFAPGRDFGNAQHLVEILKNFNPSEYSYSRRNLEKLKTLTFNISQAFVKMDKLLKQIEEKLNIENND